MKDLVITITHGDITVQSTVKNEYVDLATRSNEQVSRMIEATVMRAIQEYAYRSGLWKHDGYRTYHNIKLTIV